MTAQQDSQNLINNENTVQVKKSDKKAVLIIVGVILGVFLLLVGSSIYLYKSFGSYETGQNNPNETLGSKIQRFLEDFSNGNFSGSFSVGKDTEENGIPQANEMSERSSSSDSQVEVIFYNGTQQPNNEQTNQGSNQNQQNTQQYCYRYTIPEGEFKSDQCYNYNDYSALLQAYWNYNVAQSTKAGAEARIDITCDGSEFFEDNCEDAKEDREQAEKDIEKYEKEVNNLIQKGWPDS